jgi:hypothetical protein
VIAINAGGLIQFDDAPGLRAALFTMNEPHDRIPERAI